MAPFDAIVNHKFPRPAFPASSTCHLRHLPDDTVEAVLEPLHGLGLVDLVVGTDGGLRAAALGNTLTGAGPNREGFC